MAEQDTQRSGLIQELQELYQDLIAEGVLEDMELYHIDPIRMVGSEMAAFIRRLTGGAPSEEDDARETAVFASSIMAAAESIPQDEPARDPRLEEIKAPLQRSVDLLTRIIDDKGAQVSREALQQNVEILRQCLERLERGR
ncbi:MAG: hypothetical protein K9M82_12320 [Deltaproteobacteria bacterium]|nr:hypothetical protein [Deltaproteobacteria bacterium]